MPKCKQCWKEKPESQMHLATITLLRFNHQTRKKYVSREEKWFCNGTNCDQCYQMGCEG